MTSSVEGTSNSWCHTASGSSQVLAVSSPWRGMFRIAGSSPPQPMSQQQHESSVEYAGNLIIARSVHKKH